MIFLNFGCSTRFCLKLFWRNSYCKDRVTSVLLINPDDIGTKKTLYRTVSVNSFAKTQCFGNYHAFSSWTSWTQVRFKGNCPQLHRDMEFPNFDPYRKTQFKDVRKTVWGEGNEKPGHMYVVGFFGLLAGVYGLKTSLTHFIMYMAAPADVLAMASAEIDISKVAPGGCLSYKWRGKPLFIKNRTQSEIDIEAKTPLSALRDPATEEQRTTNPQWLIVIGICTHLGCVPIPNSGNWPGGFYCPCHGSHYDNIGRIRLGPAPLNLEIPPYKFQSDTLIVVG